MPESTNRLYPVFLKMDKCGTLIVGGGEVGLEKLHFLLKSSPNARVTLVGTTILPQLYELAATTDTSVQIIERPFQTTDLEGKQIVIAATEDRATNLTIRQLAKERNILVNVADTPDLCDFYMGSIVTRGPLKVAISTNGQSPTLAKRLRQLLEQELPEDIEQLIDNLHRFRNTLKDGFAHKVQTLNKLTESLLEKS